MCRGKICGALLFPVVDRNEKEYKEAIIIRKNRSAFLKKIRILRMPPLIPVSNSNFGLAYLDTIGDIAIGIHEDEYNMLANRFEDVDDNDGMPGLISPNDPSYYNSPIWNETPHHYIGVNTPAIGQLMPYVVDFDGAMVFANQSNQNSGTIIEHDDIDYNSLYPSEMISSAFAPEYGIEDTIVNPIINPIINLSGRVLPYMEEPNIENTINVEVMRNLFINVVNINTIEEVD
jgi:hypothetical protein